MEDKEIIEQKTARIYELQEEIFNLKQEIDVLRNTVETMEKNTQEYFFQMSLPEEGENE